jgi:hypothetical protein
MARLKVHTGCRDCSKCTNSEVANLTRNTGRVVAAIYTAGLSEAALRSRRKCRICGHQMSLHEGADALTPQPAFKNDEPVATTVEIDPVDVAPVAASTPDAADLVDQLTKLAALRSNDLVTDEQFQILRDQLMNRGVAPSPPHQSRTSSRTRSQSSQDSMSCLRINCNAFVILTSSYCWKHSSPSQRATAHRTSEMGRCIAVGRDGSQCSVKPRDGGTFCATHRRE